MDRVPLWKPLLILAVVASCFLFMWPPERKLKPGLDLSGGTTMLYQALVPEGASAETEIDDTISVLQNRVDPNGVRNLIWRRQAGNRIEIQMAHASPEVAKRRRAFLEAREALLKANIQPRDIDSALRADAGSRDKVLQTLAGGDAQKLAQLKALATEYDKMEAARPAYDKAQAAQRALEQKLADLPSTATQEERQKLRDQIRASQPDLTAKAQALRAARAGYDTQREAILKLNISALEIDQWLEASSTKPRARKAGDVADPVSARASAEARLIKDHPGMTAKIQALAKAFADYEEVKGPLDDPADLINILKGSGVLEFRIAANASLPDIADYQAQLAERGPRAGVDKPWRWFEVDAKGFADTEEQRANLEADPEAYLRSRGLVGGTYGGRAYVLLSNTKGSSLTEKDSGWRLTHAGITSDEFGFRAISFELNPIGADLMGSMTSSHLQEPMAIVLDGKVMSAPNINGRIDGRGQITGGRSGFSVSEAEFLVRTLKAGALKARLSEEPISIKTTGPQFGQDNLRHGLMAIVGAFIVTSAFMLIYYFFWGVVANIALVLNVLIVLGIMSLFEATFTLGGIAGIVLTIGMAVDANVLVYERIREELERGNPIKVAIRQGYQKAFSSIFDSNVTTLCTCIVLYYTASADIRGFAVTLGIGILANLFTGVFVSRVITEMFCFYVRPKNLPMLPMVWPTLKNAMTLDVDWLGKRNVFWAFSLVLIGLGFIGLYSRGADLFDIEFRGGTQVQFVLGEDLNGQQNRLSLAEVRARLDEAAVKNDVPLLKDATPVTVGETVDGKAAAFTISTVDDDAAKVGQAITQAFADVLPSGQPYEFAGMNATSIAQAPVYPITKPLLGENIQIPELREPVSAYMGGVAIVLKDVKPAATLQDVVNRIDQVRTLPANENLGSRQYAVYGTQLAPGASAAAPRYTAFVVIARDETTNYVENPSAFTEPAGLAESEWQVVSSAMKRSTSLASVSNFSPQVSNTMKQQAILACLLSCLLIVGYIWFTFGDLRYGLAAIIATLHDVLVALAFIGLSGFLYKWGAGELGVVPFRIDLTQIAALLTIIGYTINDKIVIFDRIRENRGKLAYASPTIINKSINQTLSRTFLTGGTVILSVAVLYIVGGPGVHGFAYTMFFGVVFGIYSSIAIACPMLVIGTRNQQPTAPSAGTETQTPGAGPAK